MTTDIAGLPFWELTFDADGDPDTAQRDTFLTEVPGRNITDLVIFSHGWNNNRRIATELYTGFFSILAGQLTHVPANRPTVVGLAGVIWPSQLWSDQPIPDFPAAAAAGGGGAASLTDTTPDDTGVAPADPTLDQETLDNLRELFPQATGPLNKMAALLTTPPTADAQAEFYRQLKEFSRLAGGTGDDGEIDPAAGLHPAEPRMLLDNDPTVVFERYRDALQELGVPLAGGAGGQAGLGDVFRGIWNGAKEALRGATYWQMKNRAGVVGKDGLGPLLGRLHQAAPQVRVHLIGHSFGARLVSYALAGLPEVPGPSPVKAVTLLQGAFSHFAFAHPLPFDAGRNGALVGMLDRIDGPLTVCFSTHDSAVGTMYPLASIAAGDDAAAAQDLLYRWGGMGADGAQGVQAELTSIQPAGPGSTYNFTPQHALNIDASDIVRAGGPPAGAHSDIIHPELTWIVLTAGRIAS
jgi:hypothetical protein